MNTRGRAGRKRQRKENPWQYAEPENYGQYANNVQCTKCMCQFCNKPNASAWKAHLLTKHRLDKDGNPSTTNVRAWSSNQSSLAHEGMTYWRLSERDTENPDSAVVEYLLDENLLIVRIDKISFPQINDLIGTVIRSFLCATPGSLNYGVLLRIHPGRCGMVVEYSVAAQSRNRRMEKLELKGFYVNNLQWLDDNGKFCDTVLHIH